MKNLPRILIVMASIYLVGCATASNKGVTSVSQVSEKVNEISIVRDEPTRELVHPILEEWFSENDYVFNVIEHKEDPKASDYVFTYRAWFGWDMKQYMRSVEMELYKKGESIGYVEFDAIQYGAFGKFGDTTARLKTLLDTLFNKITQDQANQLLGEE